MEVSKTPPPLPERQNSTKDGDSSSSGRPVTRTHSQKQSMRLDILVCDICLEPYDELARQAKFLTCHHSYCEVCLQRVATANASGDAPPSIECPTCRRITTLTPQGVAGLQTNFYINTMKETMVRITSSSGSSSTGTGITGNGCKKHSDQPLSFFCRRCEELICRDCTVLEHRERDGHNIQDVATAATQQREALTTNMTEAREALAKAEAAIAKLDAELAGLHRARDAAVATADAIFARYAAELDTRRREVAALVVELHSTRASGVTIRRDELAAAVGQLSAAVRQGGAITKDGSLLDVVSTATAMRACVKQLTLQEDSGNVVGNNWIAVQAESGAAAFRQAVSSLTAVTADAALPAKVTFQAHPATACLPATATMQVLDSEGQNVAAADAIDVHVYDRYEGHLSASIRTSEDEITVHFTPQVSGEHRLVASFLGEPIENAECVINVSSNNPVATFGERGDGKGNFRCPRAVAIGDEQCIFVADTGNRLIQKLDSSGKYLAQFRIGVANSGSGSGDSSGGSTSGSGSGVISPVSPGGSNSRTAKPNSRSNPPNSEKNRTPSDTSQSAKDTNHTTPPATDYSTCDLALNRSRRVIVCTETAVSENMNPTTGNTVATYSLDGCLRHRFANRLMRCALCVATNSRGDIIVSDYLVHSLFMYDRRGALIRRVGAAGAFNHPAFICVAAADTIVVSDTNNNTIQVFDADGAYQYQFGRSGSGKGELRQPFGVAVDGERILVADSGNARVQVFTLAGEFVAMIESEAAPLVQPRGIAVTGDGHVLVADRDNHCIKKFRYR